MRAYEFYWRDAEEGLHLIGILPERRRNLERITEESVMNWGRMVLGGNSGVVNFFFIQVTVYQDSGEMFRSLPSASEEYV